MFSCVYLVEVARWCWRDAKEEGNNTNGGKKHTTAKARSANQGQHTNTNRLHVLPHGFVEFTEWKGNIEPMLGLPSNLAKALQILMVLVVGLSVCHTTNVADKASARSCSSSPLWSNRNSSCCCLSISLAQKQPTIKSYNMNLPMLTAHIMQMPWCCRLTTLTIRVIATSTNTSWPFQKHTERCGLFQKKAK